MKFLPGQVFLFILLSLPGALFAAPTDTSKSTTTSDTIFVRYFKGNIFFDRGEYSAPDTSLGGFQRYFVKNSLGNPGSAISPLYLPTEGKEAGFNYWDNPFDVYELSRAKINYYYTRTPYTNLYLASGTKEEQYFKGLHTQNVSSKLNFAAGFQRLRSGGDYLRQTNTHTGAFVSSNYHSKKQRYALLANIAYNNLKAQENGGIANDTIFENIGFGDKKVLGVNLSSAERRIWNKSAFVKQYFGYGSLIRGEKSTDTTKAPAGYFTHSLFLEDNRLAYHDDNPDASFYPSILRDSLETRDSVYYLKVENRVSWCLNGKKELVPIAEIGLRHQFMRVKQNEIDTALNNVMAELDAGNDLNGLKWNVNATYVVSGGNQGDVSLKGILRKRLKDSTASFVIEARYNNSSPAFIYNRYSSNHFEWSYDWTNSQVLSGQAAFYWDKYYAAAGVTAINYDSPLYFDNYARPNQYSGSIGVLSAFVKKDIHIGNWVLANKVIYQLIPDSSIIRLPAFITDHSIYYEDKLFKRALLLRAGIDVFYTSEFTGNAYMPATSQFYLQNERKIGNYPYIDVFVNFKIRTVRAFLKYEHANAGLLGNVYYMVPHYPMADGSFVFGLSWDFYN